MKNKGKLIFISAVLIFIICIGYAFYAQQKFLANQLIAGIGNQESIEAILFHGATPNQIQSGLNTLKQQGYGDIGYIYLNNYLVYRYPLLILSISSLAFMLIVYLLYKQHKMKQQKEIELLIQMIRNEIALTEMQCSEVYVPLREAIVAENAEHLRQISEYRCMNDLQLKYLENITHQIKTPLTSLILLIDMSKTSDRETANNYMVEAEEICQQIDEITTLLLKAGKLRSNYNDLHYVQLNINELLSDCIKQSEIKYPAINYKLNAQKDFYLWADSTWLKEAFMNILDNCSRFSPDFSVVQVTIDNAFNMLNIKIEDEGCGIDEAELDNIFNRYHQNNQDKGHFGIGLHLAKEIIDAHCGRIKAYNKKSKGTCFEINLVLLQGERTFNI